MPKSISLHDVLEPLKQALLASRDVIISSQICALGDGCFMKEIPESEIQAKFLADMGENRSEVLVKISHIFALCFPEKWPQEISRKLLLIFHDRQNKILSPRDSGSGGSKRMLGAHSSPSRKSALRRLLCPFHPPIPGSCVGPSLELDLGDMVLRLDPEDYSDSRCEPLLGALTKLEEPEFVGVYALGSAIMRHYYAAFDVEFGP